MIGSYILGPKWILLLRLKSLMLFLKKQTRFITFINDQSPLFNLTFKVTTTSNKSLTPF